MSNNTNPPHSLVPNRNPLERELSDAIVFFHHAVAGRLGMNPAEWKCLGILEQRGQMAAGQLAALSGFTTGAITGIVDRLEKAGLARRGLNPVDRRSVVVSLGDLSGLKEELRLIFGSLIRAMEEVASHYTPEERRTIETWLERTRKALREETRKLGTSRPIREKAKKGGTNGKLSVPGGQ